jgi:hypothetical protein
MSTPNPGFFPTYPVHSRTTDCHRRKRMPQAITNDLWVADPNNRKPTHISTTTNGSMSFNATYNRRGAKARKTTKPPAGGASSAEYHQREHQKSPEDHNPHRKQEENHNTTLQRPAHTWAASVRESPTRKQTRVTYKSQTYHTVGKDAGFIYPFATQPHLLLTWRYSGSDNNKNEIVFRHLFPAGHAATRELLQRLRTEAHSAIH